MKLFRQLQDLFFKTDAILTTLDKKHPSDKEQPFYLTRYLIFIIIKKKE